MLLRLDRHLQGMLCVLLIASFCICLVMLYRTCNFNAETTMQSPCNQHAKTGGRNGFSHGLEMTRNVSGQTHLPNGGERTAEVERSQSWNKNMPGSYPVFKQKDKKRGEQRGDDAGSELNSTIKLTETKLDTLMNYKYSATRLHLHSHEVQRNELFKSESSDNHPRMYREYATIADLPVVHVDAVDCRLLFAGDKTEITRATDYQKQHPKEDGINYLEETADCHLFRARRGYITSPMSASEKEFPLAFAIMTSRDIGEVESLLRAIYRPQNYYCTHVDKKASNVMVKSLVSIANCFPNVFVLSRTIDVHLGYFSALEAELLCIDHLVKYKDWKYFINLTGQEFPLKTNKAIVNILQAFQGANDIPGVSFNRLPQTAKKQVKYVHIERKGMVDIRKVDFPYNITLSKGTGHILASRAFAEYIATDPIALQFREWCRDTGEHLQYFYSSLEYSPQLVVPGAYTGAPQRNMTVTRWQHLSHSGYRCRGKYVRNVCIIGVGDLQHLHNTMYLFVNKLHMEYHPLAYRCLEELHFNKTRNEIVKRRQVNVKKYSELKFVRDRVGGLKSNDP